MKFILIIIVSIFLPLTLFAQNIVINEVMSSNSNTIADTDGDFGDWIELYNADNLEINLIGFGLSDNATDPYRWIFPEVILLPGEDVLVWASGKDRRKDPDYLHTNVSLERCIYSRYPGSSRCYTCRRIPVYREGSYIFDVWDSEKQESSFPSNMVFQQSRIDDPGLYDDLYLFSSLTVYL
jgi:hypothetical protein